MILTAYKYVYYRIYSWNLRMWGESDLPHFNALLAVSYLAFMNLMSIPSAVELVIGHTLFGNGILSKVLWFGPALAVFVFSYFFLVAGRKYKAIAKEFSHETKIQRRNRLAFVWLYAIGSIAVTYGLIAIRHSLKRPLIEGL